MSQHDETTWLQSKFDIGKYHMGMRYLYAIAFGYSSMNNQSCGTASGFDLQGDSSPTKKCLIFGLPSTFLLHFWVRFGCIPYAGVQ